MIQIAKPRSNHSVLEVEPQEMGPRFVLLTETFSRSSDDTLFTKERSEQKRVTSAKGLQGSLLEARWTKERTSGWMNQLDQPRVANHCRHCIRGFRLRVADPLSFPVCG